MRSYNTLKKTEITYDSDLYIYIYIYIYMKSK